MAQHNGPDRQWENQKPMPARVSPGMQASRPRPKGRGLWAVFCFLFALIGVGVILYSTLFRLKHVQVLGTSHRTPQEVATIAGIAEGDNILLLDKSKIRDSINKDRYLVFVQMQRNYPDGLVIEVHERVPRVNIQSMGVQYTLDEEGMVLEQTQVLQLDEGLVAVTGLDITSSILGRFITCRSETQLQSYRQVLKELSMQEAISQISELNLADVDNLYLVSVDGYTIRLGDAGDMQAKIGSMRAVIENLRQNGFVRGNIDFSVPINPTYTPAQ